MVEYSIYVKGKRGKRYPGMVGVVHRLADHIILPTIETAKLASFHWIRKTVVRDP